MRAFDRRLEYAFHNFFGALDGRVVAGEQQAIAVGVHRHVK